MRQHTLIIICASLFLIANLSSCVGTTAGNRYQEDYTGRPKPVPVGRTLLGKAYYPRGTRVYPDGSLYIPAETTIVHGMVYPKEGCAWVDPYSEFDLRVECRQVNLVKIIPTRLEFVGKKIHEVPRITNFGPGESPVLMFGSTIGGKTSFAVIEESTGNVVHSESIYLEPNNGFFRQLKRSTLNAGMYSAVLTVGEGYNASCAFSVHD